MRAFKFSSTATVERPSILGGLTEKQWLHDKYENGRYNFGMDYLTRYGTYKIAGWCFDFTPFLCKYLVHGSEGWQTLYAPNKSAARKVWYGKWYQIITLEKFGVKQKLI